MTRTGRTRGTDGIAYGDISLTVALHGEISESRLRTDGEVRSASSTPMTPRLFVRAIGQLPAWFCRLPGQPPVPPGRALMPGFVGDGCLPGPPLRPSCRTGSKQTPRHSPPWLSLRPAGRPPITTISIAGDVGHTLVLGATGSGKSFLLNFLLVQALRNTSPGSLSSISAGPTAG